MNIELFERENYLNVEVLRKSFLDYIDVSDKTIETYDKALKQFAIYLSDNCIKQPTREDIINYREFLKLDHKSTTVNGYMIAVRNFFKYLEYQGIFKNITENVKNVKLESKHLKRGLSIEEVSKVLKCCKNKQEELIIKLMISCGLRSNELVNIRLQDFKNDCGTIMLNILGKGRDGYKQDQVKIDDRLFNDIKSYVKDFGITDYLFESKKSSCDKISTRTIRRLAKRIFEECDFDNLDMLSAHSFRHTSCDLALESGMSIQEVSENMRHKSIQTTMIYKNELDKRNSQFANKLCDLLY